MAVAQRGEPVGRDRDGLAVLTRPHMMRVTYHNATMMTPVTSATNPKQNALTDASCSR
jgi:hypothetical protein